MTLSTRIRFETAKDTNYTFQVFGGEANTSNIDAHTYRVDCRLKSPNYYVYLSGSANSVSDVSGVITRRDAADNDISGQVDFYCNNPTWGRPWFEVGTDSRSFSVNTDHTWIWNGIELKVTRLDDSGSFKEWLVVLR